MHGAAAAERGHRRGAANRRSGIFGQLEDLADDELGGVVDDAAVEVENLAGAAGVSQHIAPIDRSVS